METKLKLRTINRDVSWLSFNERVLLEAARTSVPLGERINFLSIYSSNLDEFYRVRMPALLALHSLTPEKDIRKREEILPLIQRMIQMQLEQFGQIMARGVLLALRRQHVHVLYNMHMPARIRQYATEYFYNQVAAFLHITDLAAQPKGFFPANNALYLAVAVTGKSGKESTFVLNIPSDSLSRFYTVEEKDRCYIVFLDDVIKGNLDRIFPGHMVTEYGSFKITRDAELDLEDEFEGDLARKIEKRIARRDFGLATRFLYEPCLSPRLQEVLRERLGLGSATMVSGGTYHNLRDLSALPLRDPSFFYERWPVVRRATGAGSLFDDIVRRDFMLHTPYQSYEQVLRFFNEAAIDPRVTRIFVTLYRVASDSRIVNALINAARNGKKVTVFVELKARFDEANNIRWARKMKEAGVRIIYSIPGLKVHAKIALVKRKCEGQVSYVGLLSTGNFNESTARFYTDHILFTAHRDLLREMEILFRFLKQRHKPPVPPPDVFRHLLVAQFNLLPRFIALIDREIVLARQGKPAAVTIKLNNLEEKVLIHKLYEASAAGVRVSLIVRSICCLVPGVKGLSEHITVRRIVDRYLEHGRIFIFHNDGDPEIYMGSADWMNRNIYRRIEVCFPVYNEAIKSAVQEMMTLQLSDNVQAVTLDDKPDNVVITPAGGKKTSRVRSQHDIARFISSSPKPRRPGRGKQK